METVAVVVSTYGDRDIWSPLAERALNSVGRQTRHADQVVWHHGRTLQEARNGGAATTNSDYLIFLDADDELEPTYIEEMLKGTADIRRPSTRGIYEDGTIEDPPSLIPRARFGYC